MKFRETFLLGRFPPQDPDTPREGPLFALGAAPLYREASKVVADAIRAAEKGEPPDLGRGREVVSAFIESLGKSPDLLLAATDRRAQYSLSEHSVNVTILALKMAQTLGFSREAQLETGMAALFHEIGVIQLPVELVHKTGPVSRRELEELRRRPDFSAQILRQAGEEARGIAEIVEQMQEREDGSGFPRGLMGREIREEAKVVGLANAFEACLHNRPYRRALTGYQAVLEFTSESTPEFSHRILKALLKSFSLYPYNEFVVLQTGEIGKVVDINPENLMRPVVELLYDSQGNRLSHPRRVDLTQNTSVYITRAISPDVLPDQE